MKTVEGGVGGELVGEDVVGGKQKTDALCFRFGEGGFGDVELVGFDEGPTSRLALRVEEGIGHASADDDGVGFFKQVVDDADLVGDLGPADDGDEGLVWLCQGFAHIGELFFHQQTGGGVRDEVGDAFRRGVGPVGAAEGVVDVDVAKAGELFRKGGVVGLFFWVEAEVFKQEGLAGFKIGGEFGGDLAYAIGGEGDVFVGIENVVEEIAEMVDDGAQAH